jgi:pilus assembly protein CpaC
MVQTSPPFASPRITGTQIMGDQPCSARLPMPPSRDRLWRVMVIVQRWGMLIVAGVALALGAVPAKAQTRVGAGADARSGAVMNVPINKSQTLRVDRPIGKAAIGNDKIADVLPVSLSSVYILGKEVGSTNLSLFDKKGGLIAVVDIVVSPDTQGLKRKLAELLPTERIGVSVSNDSVVLDGRVSSPAAAERVAAVAETFAPKKVINMMTIGTPQQIMLEVRFSEMSRGTVKALGISNFSFGRDTTTGAQVGNGTGIIAGPDGPLGSYSAFVTFPLSNLSFQLDALEQQGLVRTLAQPNLVALSGETAAFLAGGEFPIPSNVTQNGQVQIEFKEFGVSLKFTPTLLEDGLINLLVAPEVSQLDASAGIDLNGIRIPGLKTRRAKTTIELRDGQSFALAGLIQSDFSNTVRQVPLLGQVPIIGALFRSTNFNRQETELVMVVTPRIVRPVQAGTTLATPTDRVQEPSDLDMFLLGKTENVQPLRPMNPLPGPDSAVNKPRPPAGARPTAEKAGGVDGEFGHIVR